jgi:hypothetical protein
MGPALGYSLYIRISSRTILNDQICVIKYRLGVFRRPDDQISYKSVQTQCSFSKERKNLSSDASCVSRIVRFQFTLAPQFCSVLGIRIRRIRMFLGLPDADPDPVVRGTDPRIMEFYFFIVKNKIRIC